VHGQPLDGTEQQPDDRVGAALTRGLTRRKPLGLKDLEKRLGKLTVGELIHTFRMTDELSLKEFGKLIGVSVANLCDIEKGRKGVSPKKAEQIGLSKRA
jgi:hypothetical protein